MWQLAVAASLNRIAVATNALLDGATVQANTSACIPAAGWSATRNGSSLPAFALCYNPSSATPGVGGSIVFVPEAISQANSSSSAPLVPGAVYRLTGSIVGQGGETLSLDLVVTVDP